MHTAPNGKRYIGITGVEPEERWRKGSGYQNNAHFVRAIQKYGWDNIQHDVLLTGLTRDEACEKEIELIKLYDATNPECGYNICRGGSCTIAGLRLSQETRDKMSHARMGHFVTEETRNKIRTANTGKKASDETKQKISDARKRYFESPEAHAAQSAILTGRVLSEEHKQHISDSLKGRTMSDETKDKLREINTGKAMSDESRMKMSMSHQGKQVSEDTKRKISEASKGRKFSDEHRRKISEAQKRRWAKQHIKEE